ncbi:MAG TPA: hypothetical protein VLN45_04500, partial [Ignavibacteriaceae bacterium]|nr:hypothetical protein [Ignavibacteriaceae bacterium]
EGYQHGLHSIQFLKHYNDFFTKLGHKKINLNSYKKIILDFKNSITKKHADSFYSATFNSGKKVGKILGSFKHSYLDI